MFTFWLFSLNWRRERDCRSIAIAHRSRLGEPAYPQTNGRPARLRWGFACVCSNPGVLIPGSKQKSQKCFSLLAFHFSPKIGGERGIRTPGALRHTTFPMLRHRPTRPSLQLKKSSIYSVSLLKKQFKRCRRRLFVHGAPGGDRTHNLRLRRPTLYPIELQVQERRVIL